MTAENVSAGSMRDSTTSPTIEQLVAEPPKLHSAGGSLTSRWKLQDADLRYLDHILRPGMRTLETGAGISTVVFALKGTDHTCIVPDQGLVDRIKNFCAESAIPLANVDFVVEHSEQALPRLTRQDYDFALIDGRHGFPAPFIDCYYVAGLLKVGGSVMIDDLHIWTIELLVEYLRADANWQLGRETWHTATFVKRTDDALRDEWTRQPFVVKRSLRKSFLAKLRLLQRMARTRDFTPLRRLWGT
ncbi:MAG TPA: class I SAM-dependent methyltransferase [Gemmatimonadales bacterium]|nr:class I SAM-dependent methyltransferase [Gemmatimonadales bacterium]